VTGWLRYRMPAGDRSQVVVFRPGAAAVAAEATGRLLAGCLTGFATWLMLHALGMPGAAVLACLTTLAVAVAGLSGLVLAAAGTGLVSATTDIGAPVLVAVAVTLIGLTAAAVARRVGRRCGALPVGVLCVMAVLGGLVIGWPGVLLAPPFAAAVRIIGRGRPQ
jgi:predicted PurR-regulated permease PerM